MPVSRVFRRIVVRPDQVFQRDFLSRRAGLSFEGQVIHYVLVSTAIVAGLSILGALGLMLALG